MSGSLVGAVKANTEYRFAFEPIRAIVGMTRQFTIDAVRIEISGLQPFFVKQFPATFLEPIELVKPLLTNRPPINITSFDHFGNFGPAKEKAKLGSGKTLDVYFQENFPEGKYLKIWWVPTLYLDNEQSLALPEYVKKITPKKFTDEIKGRIYIESHELVSNEKAQADYYFGPSTGIADQQGTIYLYDKDYTITLTDDVAWSSNGNNYPQFGPRIFYSQSNSGKYILSATGTFTIEPKEGKDFTSTHILPVDPLSIKVLGELQIKNAITETVSDFFKLSYRAQTPFKAIVKGDDGTEEAIAVTWKLDGEAISALTARGKILNYLGIREKDYQIGCLPGSSSTQIGVSETITSLFSGRVKLIANHGKLAKTTTLNLSQPTVYCHFKQVKGFDAGDTQKQIEDWITEANKLWGQENLIEIKLRNYIPVEIDNASFSPAIASSSEEKLKDPLTYLNPLTWDHRLNEKYHIDNLRITVVPRQARYLLQQNRVASSANVFLTKQPYWVYWLEPPPPDPQKLPSTTISGDDYVRTIATNTFIDDTQESGLIIQVKVDGMNGRTLAHELGHLLIQAGSEHHFSNGELKPENYLMNIFGNGDLISPEEFLKALDHSKKKSFIEEEW